MKKLLGMFCAAVCLFVGALPVSADAPEPPQVSAQGAVLYAPETGELLYEKNGERRLPMASTTKIMTALLTLIHIDRLGDRTVTVTEEMVRVEGSSMGLRAGDEIRLSQLCRGMLLCSGNDAANAAAIAVGGSTEKFAELMNNAAAILGMENTSFVTPSGLDSEGHYTCARDLALLTAVALKNKTFSRIVSSRYGQVRYFSREKGNITVRFQNHNRLLTFMEDCVGVKTGYTKKSGRCLVSAVRRSGALLICVTLNAPDDWNDHIRLYETGYSSLKQYRPRNTEFTLPLAEGGTVALALRDPSPIPYFTEGEITETVYLPKFLYGYAGEECGRVEYSRNGKVFEVRAIGGL